MAERRCFSRKVVESDAFRSLDDSCQALYLHLNMAADDDGFINCAGVIAAGSPSGADDLKLLVEKRFLLKFDGVYVVKHWRISNSLKADRLREPAYPGIAARIYVNSNRAYTLRADCGGKSLLELKTGRISESKMDSILDSQENRIEQKRREDNRTEGKAGFRRLFEAYPPGRRGTADVVWEVYEKRIRSEADCRKAAENLMLWKRSDQWNKNDGKYIPNLVNWLERGLWAQQPDVAGKGALGVLGEPEMEAIRQVLEE